MLFQVDVFRFQICDYNYIIQSCSTRLIILTFCF